jgi:hypothetical protein
MMIIDPNQRCKKFFIYKLSYNLKKKEEDDLKKTSQNKLLLNNMIYIPRK